jgi:hypothetical protein
VLENSWSSRLAQ